MQFWHHSVHILCSILLLGLHQNLRKYWYNLNPKPFCFDTLPTYLQPYRHTHRGPKHMQKISMYVSFSINALSLFLCCFSLSFTSSFSYFLPIPCDPCFASLTLSSFLFTHLSLSDVCLHGLVSLQPTPPTPSRKAGMCQTVASL